MIHQSIKNGFNNWNQNNYELKELDFYIGASFILMFFDKILSKEIPMNEGVDIMEAYIKESKKYIQDIMNREN